MFDLLLGKKAIKLPKYPECVFRRHGRCMRCFECRKRNLGFFDQISKQMGKDFDQIVAEATGCKYTGADACMRSRRWHWHIRWRNHRHLAPHLPGSDYGSRRLELSLVRIRFVARWCIPRSREQRLLKIRLQCACTFHLCCSVIPLLGLANCSKREKNDDFRTILTSSRRGLSSSMLKSRRETKAGRPLLIDL